MPFQAYYVASKFAVEGLSETMSMELKRFKIRTVLVEPGDIKTSFTSNRIFIKKIESDRQDLIQFRKTLEIIEKDENNGGNPLIVAKIVKKIVGKKRPCFRYPATKFEQSPVPLLKRILPYAWFEKIIASHYKV